MRLPEPIKKWLPTALIGGAAGSVLYFASQIIDSIAAPFWQYIAPAIPQKLLLSLCCLLLLAAGMLGAYVIYLCRAHREPIEAEKREAFDAQFGEFVASRGVWTHKTKPGYFCNNCKAKLRESRMLELSGGRGWQCMIEECKQTVYNPDYRPPEPPQDQSPYIDFSG